MLFISNGFLYLTEEHFVRRHTDINANIFVVLRDTNSQPPLSGRCSYSLSYIPIQLIKAHTTTLVMKRMKNWLRDLKKQRATVTQNKSRVTERKKIKKKLVQGRRCWRDRYGRRYLARPVGVRIVPGEWRHETLEMDQMSFLFEPFSFWKILPHV